jgi:hypothetical protein
VYEFENGVQETAGGRDVRMSTGEQSPELQMRELRDYAGRRGFTVSRDDADQASGDVRRRQRPPEFDAQMERGCRLQRTLAIVNRSAPGNALKQSK